MGWEPIVHCVCLQQCAGKVIHPLGPSEPRVRRGAGTCLHVQQRQDHINHGAVLHTVP